MITSGTVLMGKDTKRPRCFELEDDPYPNAWMSLKHNLNSFELEKELISSEWTFFYMANQISTTAFGFDRPKVIHTAVNRLITEAKNQKCNCLEIDDVVTRSFLGLPYITVSAHPRHIQKGMVFSGQ